MMHRIIYSAAAAIILFSPGVFADSREVTLTLGGSAGWSRLESLQGLTSAPGRLGKTALVLDSAAASKRIASAGTADLLLSFDSGTLAVGASDETGNYRIVAGELRPVGASSAYRGNGAAAANAGRKGLELSGKPGSLFGGETATDSFTIRFWMRPATAENGSELFRWQSSITEAGSSRFQYARAGISGNRMEWTFSNVWSKNGAGIPDVILRGSANLIPGVWSHHSLSYDADRGALSYRVNGKLETIRYLTDNGRETGSVYPSRFGRAAYIDIADGFAGLIDEFAILRYCADPENLDDYRQIIDRFTERSGRFTSEIIDTGGAQSRVLSFSVDELIPSDAGSAYFARVGETMWNWTENDPPWVPVTPGKPVPALSGRFFQIAGELYPDGTGTKSPAVTEVSLTYERDAPSWPPVKIFTEPGDGTVKVTWKASPDGDTAGYLVYYGERPGEYLAEGSPIDAGSALETVVRGLVNGRMYYFSVAAYDAAGPSGPGPLSVESGARPRVRPPETKAGM